MKLKRTQIQNDLFIRYKGCYPFQIILFLTVYVGVGRRIESRWYSLPFAVLIEEIWQFLG